MAAATGVGVAVAGGSGIVLGSNGSMQADTMRRAGDGTGRLLAPPLLFSGVVGSGIVGVAGGDGDGDGDGAAGLGLGGIMGGGGSDAAGGSVAAARGGGVAAVGAGMGDGEKTGSTSGDGARFLGISRPGAAFLNTNLNCWLLFHARITSEISASGGRMRTSILAPSRVEEKPYH